MFSTNNTGEHWPPFFFEIFLILDPSVLCASHYKLTPTSFENFEHHYRIKQKSSSDCSESVHPIKDNNLYIKEIQHLGQNPP